MEGGIHRPGVEILRSRALVRIGEKTIYHRDTETQRRLNCFLSVSVSLCLILCFPCFTDAKVYIDITAPSAKRLPIAIQGLHSMEGEVATAASKITEIISQDLEMSDVLRVLDRTSYPKELLRDELSPEKIEFKSWVAIGTEVLVKGRVTMDGRKVTVDARLYDVTAGKQLMAFKYTRDIKEIRRIAHKIADEIIANLTGEKGVFSTRMAFVSTSTGNKEIYSVDYDGDGVEALTQNGSINLSPSLSPDGSAISYISFKGGRPAVYIKDNLNGKENKLPIQEGTFMGASWAPDGKRLAVVVSIEGNADIYLINRDGSGLARLTDNWGLDVSPSWSPTGKEIAFVSDRGGSPQIYLMDSSGGSVRRLTFEGSYNASPAWAPKRDRIAFAGTSNGKFDIFTINSDGSDLRQLTANAGNNENPTWSPDGRFMSFSSTRDGAASIYIMHSDGTGQKRITRLKGSSTSPSWGPRPKE